VAFKLTVPLSRRVTVAQLQKQLRGVDINAEFCDHLTDIHETQYEYHIVKGELVF
jgi:hypothetical protein